MSIDRWMDKEDVAHIYNGKLLSHKKEWNNAICSNIDGPRDYHTKWSKSDRERQISYDIAYMQYLKKMIQMHLFTKQKQTHRLREWTYGYWGGKVEGMDRLGVWDQHVHMYVYMTCWLSIFKIDKNKNILYSTRNSAQYSVIT